MKNKEMETAYHQITLDEYLAAKEEIANRLKNIAGDYVAVGYLLRRIKETEAYRQEGYESLGDFAKREYGLSESAVSRFIAINARFSVGGGSRELLPEYSSFGSSRLSEMLTLSDSDCGLITEATTIATIRDIKRFNREEEEYRAKKEEAKEASAAPEPAQKRVKEERLHGKEPKSKKATTEPHKEAMEAADNAETVEADILAPERKPQTHQPAPDGQKAYTPMQQCIIEFFRDKEKLLNEIYTLSSHEEIVDRINPSGSGTFRKGVHMLFMYEYDRGVVLKTMGEPNTICSWNDFIAQTVEVYRDTYRSGETVWSDFYRAEKEIKENSVDVKGEAGGGTAVKKTEKADAKAGQAMPNDLISRKDLKKALEAELKECLTDGGEAELFAVGFEDAIDLVKNAPSAPDLHGKRSDQDKAAHQVYAFAMDERNMQNVGAPKICSHCGGRIETHRCGGGLYLVRCLSCKTAALTQAGSPREAAGRTIGKIKGY